MLRKGSGAVGRGRELAKSLTVEWAPHGTGCFDFRFQFQKGRLIGREANALPRGHGVEHTGGLRPLNKTDGTRLQVSFGHDTALIYLWQVVKTNSANTDTRKSR
jgi:hypothetical protein